MYELTLGLHELVVTATDKAGNQTTSTVRFFVTTSFRDMQNLLDRFKATGRLSAQAHKQLSNKLDRGPAGRGERQRHAGRSSSCNAFRDARRRTPRWCPRPRCGRC